MQISQEGQFKSKISNADIDLLVILFAYAGPIINVLLFLLQRNSRSGQMAIAYVIVAVGSVLLFFRYAKRRVPVAIITIVAVMVLAMVSFIITQFTYGRTNPLFISEQRAFLGMEGCALLLSLNIVWSRKTEVNKGIILAFDVVLSVVSFLALTRGNSLTTGGLIADTSGFLYQNIAYYSAYCLGLNMFLLAETNSQTKTALIKLGYIVLSLLQLFTCFMSGGRGGVVLALGFLVYVVFSVYGRKRAYKIIVPSIILILAVKYIFPNLMSRVGLDSSGLTRVLSLFSKGATDNLSDRGRMALANRALTAFWERPILGNGIGSVFYLLGNYSHNMFTDILAETGIVGLMIVIALLGHAVRKAIKLYRAGSLYRFMLILLISGLILNLFSGYVWVNQHIWLPVIVFLLTPIKDICEEQERNIGSKDKQCTTV